MLAYQLAHAVPVNARLSAVAALHARAGQPDAPAAATALAAAARGDRFWAVRQGATAALGAFVAPAAVATGESGGAGGARTAPGTPVGAAGATGPAADTARSALLAATRDPDPRVRSAAATVLARVPGPEVAARLRELAQRDSSLYVRGAAVRAFAALEPAAALPVIDALLGQASWTDVLRVSALAALAHLPPDTAVPILERYLGPENSRFAREAAIATLMRTAQGHQADVAHRLEPLLADPDLFIRGEVARALGALGQPSSVAALEARRRVEAEGRVVSAIDQALARLGGR